MGTDSGGAFGGVHNPEVPLKTATRLLALSTLFAGGTARAASFHSLLSTYSGYDYDNDGIDEIDALSPMTFTWGNPSSSARVVVVFVEDRLLDSISGASYSTAQLTARLERLAEDLRAEGYTPRFVQSRVYDGAAHQDGKTVLAMREFLRDVHGSYPNLEGALLIGDFPESMLVRRWLWKRSGNGTTINGVAQDGSEILRAIPELVDGRSEVVLADLDGNWEDLYVEAPTAVQGVVARPASAGWWSDSWAWRSFS